jgi:nucleoside-diphosphate-sugar epimerase
MPLTAYARSKVESEEALERLAAPGFTVTALRFSTACGMSHRLRLDLVLNDFVASALATRNIAILSDGKPWRPLIHVEDMATALDWAISRGGDPYLAINVGRDDWNVQVRDLAEAVRGVLPQVDVSVNKDAQPDRRSYRVSFARYRALAPGHQPEWTLERTVRDLVAGLGAIGFADAQFRSSRLVRLVVLKSLREQGLLGPDLRWTELARGRP